LIATRLNHDLAIRLVEATAAARVAERRKVGKQAAH